MNNLKGLSEKKRAEIAAVAETIEPEGNKMVSLNEIASLVQRLLTIMSNSKRDVLGVNLGRIGDYVQLDHIAFLTEFIDFDIGVRDGMDYPYELSSKIGDVTFYAVMFASDIIDLKTTIPEQFDYITAKVQVDEV